VGLSRILFVLSACLFVSIAAQAGPIYRYTYSGPNYYCCGVNNTSLPYTTDMHFQLVVDFDAPLAADVLYVTPLDWSGFDGVNALSSDACTSCTRNFRIGSVNSTPYPSAPGPVQGWDISIWDTSHGISWSSWWGCGGCGDQLDSIFASGGWGPCLSQFLKRAHLVELLHHRRARATNAAVDASRIGSRDLYRNSFRELNGPAVGTSPVRSLRIR